MTWKEYFKRSSEGKTSLREAKEEKPYVPVSRRICPICGEIIGFDVSFISGGDESYHVVCVDDLIGSSGVKSDGYGTV